MNATQALKKARKVFGYEAAVKDAKKNTVSESGAILARRFRVGRNISGLFFSVHGTGTWEDAFEQAEKAK